MRGSPIGDTNGKLEGATPWHNGDNAPARLSEMVLDMMKISVRDKIVHGVKSVGGLLGEGACGGERQAARDYELWKRSDGKGLSPRLDLGRPISGEADGVGHSVHKQWLELGLAERRVDRAVDTGLELVIR